METGANSSSEGTKHPESIVITKESLMADNRSEKAKELSAEWEKNRNNGNLWAIVACGDARIMIPEPTRIVSIRSIATGGKKESKIFKSPGVKLAVVMSHIDGETIVSGKRPKGCGGSAAKEQTLNGNGEKSIEGIQYYIDKNVEHPDPIIQAAITAKEIAKKTRKPSLAVVQDHRTGKIYPFAAFLEGYDIVSSDIDWISLLKGYHEAEIYTHGVPILPEAVIPEVFREFINSSKEYMANMLRTYPNLKNMQETQNPRMVVISSKLPSIRIRYPETTDVPGLLFKLHMPREKNGSKTEITSAIQKEIINQAQYPLEHAVHNFGQLDKPFSRTNRVLVETSDINLSRNLAAELAKKPWMKEWLTLPDHKILVIQNQEGISNIIEDFAPAKA